MFGYCSYIIHASAVSLLFCIIKCFILFNWKHSCYKETSETGYTHFLLLNNTVLFTNRKPNSILSRQQKGTPLFLKRVLLQQLQKHLMKKYIFNNSFLINRRLLWMFIQENTFFYMSNFHLVKVKIQRLYRFIL